jgi:acyl carrier protein
LSANRFVPNPFGAAGTLLYRTGDRAAFLPDGRVSFLGRVDFQIKVRGYRIEPSEIESALVFQPGVAQAVAVAQPDPVGGQRLVAYVVPNNDFPPTSAATLRVALAAQLPAHMVPAALILLPNLPLTPSGKVDRRALPLPAGVSDQPYAAPVGVDETILSQIWAEVLGVGRVGRNDDFVALGGHSLAAAQVVARAQDRLGVELSLASLFEAHSLAALAEQVVALRAIRTMANPASAVGREEGEL